MLREPVSPVRNVERFATTPARFVRMEMLDTNNGEPCLDEVELWSGSDTVARRAETTIQSSGDLPGFQHLPLFQVQGKYLPIPLSRHDDLFGLEMPVSIGSVFVV